MKPLIFKVIETCVSIMVIMLLLFAVMVCVLGCILCFNSYGFVFPSAVSLLCSSLSKAQNIVSCIFF